MTTATATGLGEAAANVVDAGLATRPVGAGQALGALAYSQGLAARVAALANELALVVAGRSALT